MQRLFLFVLGPLLLVAACNAQAWNAGVRGHYGFLWPHRPSSWILVEGHAPALEVFGEKRVSGKKAWHGHYAMPAVGVGLLYTTLANEQRIGTAVRLLPYLYLPFRPGKSSSFGMRLGWGVGYIAKPFERTDNSKQIAIGSRINTAIQLMPEYRVSLGHTRVQIGIGIDHWSNGSFKLPNLGLNYLSLGLAVSHALGKEDATLPSGNAATDTSRLREWTVVVAFGMNETARPLSGQYTVYTATAQRMWQVTDKSLLMAGADVFNKGTLATVHPEMRGKGRGDYTQLAIHGGYGLRFGRGELFLHMGAYLYTPVPDEAPVFHRLGCRYRTGDHLIWNVSLKSHYAVADHWEFGIGYRWD